MKSVKISYIDNIKEFREKALRNFIEDNEYCQIEFMDESLIDAFGENPLFNKKHIDVECGLSKHWEYDDKIKLTKAPSIGDTVIVPEVINIIFYPCHHPYIDEKIGKFMLSKTGLKIIGIKDNSGGTLLEVNIPKDSTIEVSSRYKELKNIYA